MDCVSDEGPVGPVPAVELVVGAVESDGIDVVVIPVMLVEDSVDDTSLVEPIDGVSVEEEGYVVVDWIEPEGVVSPVNVVDVTTPLDDDSVDWSVAGLFIGVDDVEATVSVEPLLPELVVIDSVDGGSVADIVTVDAEEPSVVGVSSELVTELIDDDVAVEDSSVLVLG